MIKFTVRETYLYFKAVNLLYIVCIFNKALESVIYTSL